MDNLIDALLGRGGGIRNRLAGDDLETGLNAHDTELRQRTDDVIATQGPLFKDWLTNSLMYGLMALPGRSARGARIGNDNVWAAQVERKLNRMENTPNPSWDRGVTGGTDPNSMYTVPRSAEALARDYALQRGIPSNITPFRRTPAND